ncbi:MAG: response regulator transcription factor [Chitinophagaceae bacterium]|nr:response regulator transcription factor [Chitinophagaceae bacterium]
MLNAIIIEDEKPAMEALIQSLSKVSPQVHIKARLSSVKESICFFSGETDADLIFSDVQLTDGLSFDIFSAAPVRIPVIFITGYDEFMMQAFETNGIDYLLKPVEKEQLDKALQKFRNFQQHFNHSQPVMDKLNGYFQQQSKKRVLVKNGNEYIPLKVDDILLFYTENKIVFAIDRCGKKYQADRKLSDLETEMDTSVFFRANRQYLVNINYVKGFRAYEKVKIVLDLTIPLTSHVIIISQETAPQFRKWINEY